MPNEFDLTRRLVIVLVLAALLLATGTLGYMAVESSTAWDSFFMTIITLSTVGYEEEIKLSPGGERFTALLIILGVGALAYSFSTVADYIVAGELRGILRRRRMERRINNLNGHYIICGYGRVGQQVAEGLEEERLDFVVIDNQAEVLEALAERGINYIADDASDDNVLLQAGIERAAGLCACLPNDATNVFVTLTARQLNPGLMIISRGHVPTSASKLQTAGANHVINPYLIAGRRMAAQLRSPTVTEFLEVVMQRGELELRIEEVVVGQGSLLADKTMAENHVRRETGVNILAVRRENGRHEIDLGPEFLLCVGDALICLGTPEQLDALAERASHRWRFPLRR